jgi:hypothetical protein
MLKEDIESWLKDNNVVTVKAYYMGGGDEGGVDEILIITKNNDNFVSIDEKTCPHYDNLCYIISDNVYSLFPGYEINEGGSGFWEWDVDTGIIRIEHEQNILTVECEEHTTTWNVLTLPDWIKNNNG